MGNQYNSLEEFVLCPFLKGAIKMVNGNAAIKNKNSVALSNVTELKIPRMVTIQALADKSGFSYKTLWKLCKQGKIVYVRAGNKYLINFDRFIEFLNTGEHGEVS